MMSLNYANAGCTVLAAICLTGIAGCPPAARYHRPLEPVADRLVRTYPDLASGRFLSVADFESIDQGAIFRLIPPTAAGYVGIVPERARPETGAGSLKVRFTSGEQELVVEDVSQGQWTLPRDWTPFHLFLVSIHAPRPLTGAAFTARSGTDKPREYQQKGIVLREGWNLVKIDIGDMAERIDTADIRQLRFGCPHLEDPVDLYFDDMVLADNAKNVLGSPSGNPGDLYVRTEGRRARVGVVERFELVFARGRIVQWFDLQSDANRLHNLTGGGPLGPTPVWLPGDPDEIVRIDETAGWEKMGPAAESFQKLVEATAVRVIVWGEWRFGSPAAVASAPSGDAPFLRWVYTVYATGRVYVEFAGTLRPPAPAQRIGYLVACADGEGFRTIPHPAQPADAGGPITADSLSYVLCHRDEPNRADLLFAFFRAATAPAARTLRHGEEPRLGTLFHGGQADAVTAWAAMLNVWPFDIDGPAQAEPMVLDYVNPMPIVIDAGRLVRTDAGDIDNDGFNEARGHYTLEPDGNVVKLRLDGSRRMRFGPAFRIVDVADCDVWAYVDGLEIRPIARDADGDAVFQIPRVLDRETLVEVTSRKRPATASQPK